MRKKVNFVLFYLSFLVLIVACGKGEDVKTKRDGNQISSFVVSGVNGEIFSKSILVHLPKGTDLTDLAPVIVVSEGATVVPASGVLQDFSNQVEYTVTAEDGSSRVYTVKVLNRCAEEENIYSFNYNGKKYELVKEAKSWKNAVTCAVERGGYLAEINNGAENAAIFKELMDNAGIDKTKTVAEDGGSASYVWLGGNDLTTEGVWVWDGDGVGTSIQFWQGNYDGSAVNNRYNNWGKEPDNYGGQNALGLALTEWPKGSGSLGIAGQWNDVKEFDKLYFVIEYK